MLVLVVFSLILSCMDAARKKGAAADNRTTRCSDCYHTVSGAAGFITHEHPRYTDQRKCSYNLVSQSSEEEILVIVEDVANDCSKYELTRQGSNEDMLESWCSDGVTGVRYLTGRNFTVKFRPEQSGSFSVKYYTVVADSWRRCSPAGREDYNREFLESGMWGPGIDTETSNYFPSTDCLLFIPRNQDGHEVTINIDNMDIELDKDCSHDFVEVYTGSNVSRRYCGEQSKIELTTLTDTFLYFHSDATVTGKAFDVKYKVMGCSVGKFGKVGLESQCEYSFSNSDTEHFVCARVGAGCGREVRVGGERYCKTFSGIIPGNSTLTRDGLGGSYPLNYFSLDRPIVINVTTSKRGYAFRISAKKNCAIQLVGQKGYQIIVTIVRAKLPAGCEKEDQFIRIYSGNQGCEGVVDVCDASSKTVSTLSENAVIMYYSKKGGAILEINVMLQQHEVKSSVCDDTCRTEEPMEDTEDTTPTVIPTVASSLNWTQVERDVLIPMDFESTSLEIQTRSTPKSENKISVMFSYGNNDTTHGYRGQLGISYTDNLFGSRPDLVYMSLHYCTSMQIYRPRSADWEREESNTEGEVFKITRTSGKEPRILLQWNGELMADLVLSDELCEHLSWRYYWGQTVDAIKFPSRDRRDSASEFYRSSERIIWKPKDTDSDSDSISHGWIQTKRDVQIPLDMESRSLEVKANSILGSYQYIKVSFSTYGSGYDWLESYRGQLSIWFTYSYTKPAQMSLTISEGGSPVDVFCFKHGLEIPPPRSAGTEREQVFKIARISGDEPRIQLQWNGKLVANLSIELLNEQCRYPGRTDFWRKPMDVIKFASDDNTAYYRSSDLTKWDPRVDAIGGLQDNPRSHDSSQARTRTVLASDRN